MGCDIHMWAEVKFEHRGGKMEWETIGHVFRNQYYRADAIPLITRDSDPYSWDHHDPFAWNDPLTIHPYQDRNYVLFAILADMRNEWDIEPISQPRGFPDDMSGYMRREAQELEHTPSWLSLAELVAHDWDGLSVKVGTHHEVCADFVDETIPALQKLAAFPQVQDVRIVFYFDS